jgi:hypothetical protein
MESLTVKKFNELKIISFLRKYEDRKQRKNKTKWQQRNKKKQ